MNLSGKFRIFAMALKCWKKRLAQTPVLLQSKNNHQKSSPNYVKLNTIFFLTSAPVAPLLRLGLEHSEPLAQGTLELLLEEVTRLLLQGGLLLDDKLGLLGLGNLLVLEVLGRRLLEGGEVWLDPLGHSHMKNQLKQPVRGEVSPNFS